MQIVNLLTDLETRPVTLQGNKSIKGMKIAKVKLKL